MSDLNSRIPVSIEPGSVQSILFGNGKNSGKIQYTKNKNSLKAGSLIYTSGTGGLLKPGIPIGKTYISENQNLADSFIDFTQLRYVQVLSYKMEEKE